VALEQQVQGSSDAEAAKKDEEDQIHASAFLLSGPMLIVEHLAATDFECEASVLGEP
jgi:hypothetical protein